MTFPTIFTPTHAEIAKRAYEIWRHEFGDIDTTHDQEVEIWLRAERILEGEHKRRDLAE